MELTNYPHIFYKALRNSSGGFIARTDVREAILRKSEGKCQLCPATENLQVDHIVSVWRAAHGEFPIEKLNTYENLQMLCGSCNAAKLP